MRCMFFADTAILIQWETSLASGLLEQSFVIFVVFRNVAESATDTAL